MKIADTLARARYRILQARFAFGAWWYWKARGWPFRRRCPQCAGFGGYTTDTMARYGDDPIVCPMCAGKGLVRRSRL